MDRLDGPANLMIVSDLDLTLVDHHAQEEISLLKFNALWESNYNHDSLLIFSTGRPPAAYKQLRKKKPLLTPDITIMSVGTEIAYGESMIPDYNFEQILNQNWDRDVVLEETSKFPQLIPQSEISQRRFKVSFSIEKDKAHGVMKELSELLGKRGLDVKLIFSGGEALDVLPKGGGKGQALEYLLKKFKKDGKQPRNTLVCGDSGNDTELFTVPDVYGVMVSNAQEELLEWHAEHGKNNPNIIHATERCAAGIIEAIGHFKLGPNLSPRDRMDFSKCDLKNVQPGYEVVKFYLFYEQWRRAEVENSEEYIQNLKAVLYQSGVFVHPSGQERPLHACVDAMRNCYGDKQGKQFRIWVDRVTSAPIGSGTWLVKFDKWESCDEGRKCCVATVLLSSKDSASDGYLWLHMHQTWVDGVEATDDPTSWVL